MNHSFVWVRGNVSKLGAFASICPFPTDQFMVLAYVMNFPGATPFECKELDKLPRLKLHNVIPPFSLGFFGKMDRGPFRWAVNHCLVPRVSCWANKHVLERLRGAAQKAKGFKTISVTSLEMLSPQHRTLGLHTVIFAPVLTCLFPEKWAAVLSVGPGTIVLSPG